MNLKDFRQLKKLLTLAAANDQDHEALASFRAATKIIASSGYNWNDIINELRQKTRVVYRLVRAVDDFTGMAGEPLYIGEGFEERLKSHNIEAKRERTLRDQIIYRSAHLGCPIIEEILIKDLTKKEAVDIEEVLINLIGRYPNGPLLNISKGGSGWCIDGIALVERNKAVQRILGSPDGRQRQSDAALKAYEDPIKRANHLRGVREGVKRRDKKSHGLLTSIGTKKAMNDPIIRDHHLTAMASQDLRDRLSEIQRRPDIQEKRRARLDRMWSDQDFIDRHREATRAAMNTPRVQAKLRKRWEKK